MSRRGNLCKFKGGLTRPKVGASKRGAEVRRVRLKPKSFGVNQRLKAFGLRISLRFSAALREMV